MGTTPGKHSLPCHAYGSPPRAWGQRSRPASCPSGTAGSPPRAWGQQQDHQGVSHANRFTPTRVGTTPSQSAKGLSFPGSPPRAWGQRTQETTGRVIVRFTPTRVGTTNGHEGRLHRTHGSPPRAWGQPNSCRIGRLLRRFTPTRVRTTARSTFAAANSIGSPPRAWGQRPDAGASVYGGGSPPRAWGQRPVSPAPLGWWRFTPTRVGTTLRWWRRSHGGTVHPHARGDNRASFCSKYFRRGSPPRAWGQPVRHDRAGAAGRFTPTRVGTTRRTPARWCSGSVHPHARGDNA